MDLDKRRSYKTRNNMFRVDGSSLTKYLDVRKENPPYKVSEYQSI